MYKANHQRQTQLLALAVVLAFAALASGCTAESASQTKPATIAEEPPPATTPDVVDEKAPQTATISPTSPAEPALPVTPVPSDVPEFWQNMSQLSVLHQYENGIRWRLGKSGVVLEDATIEGHKVDTRVIQKVWANYGKIIEHWSAHYEVPIELVLTTVCVESRGNPRAKNGKNYGLMQVLVPTARNALNDPSITEESLYDPSIAIRAGTAYIARQGKSTRYDPPKVAAAYNAGRLRSSDNRWGMKQYGPHLDKTVLWFNAVLAYVASMDETPRVSFADYFRNHSKPTVSQLTPVQQHQQFRPEPM